MSRRGPVLTEAEARQRGEADATRWGALHHAIIKRPFQGVLWEKDAEIWEDVPFILDDDQERCPHAIFEFERLHYNIPSKGTLTFIDDVYVCPRAIVAYNEGGCCTTAVCADCAMEALRKDDTH